MKYWPMQLLETVSGSVAMQKEGSALMFRAVLPPKSIWMSLLWAATRDHVDNEGMHRVGPTSH